MAQSLNEQRSRINQKLDELKRDMGPGIDGLLAELNLTRLNGKGTTAAGCRKERFAVDVGMERGAACLL